ncbi:hypothetical protein MferCBS31731_001990 [Microsporum ferrugineum]
MSSMAGAFTLSLDPTQVGFLDDGSQNDYDLALSPRSDDIRAMLGSNDFSYDLDTSGIIGRKQDINKTPLLKQPFSGFEACASAFSSPPLGDTNIYNSSYHMEATIPWETDCMLYPSLPQRMVRYASPFGSCGGDQSTSDSSMSEYSWHSPKLYPSVNDVFDSPVNEKYQYSEGIDNALSRSLSGSQFGSECSVSPKDVQHYPDPVPAQSPIFEDLMISNKAPRSIPTFMPQALSIQNLDSQLNQDDMVFGEHLQTEDNEIVDPALGEAYGDHQGSLSGINTAAFSGFTHKRVKYNEMKTERTASIPSPPLSPSGSESGVRKNRAKPKQRQSPISKRTSRRTPSKSSSFSIPRNRQSAADRIFSCVFAPYGCTSSFASKNEWKRHVLSQHLQLGFYRCDIGHCKHLSPPLPLIRALLLPCVRPTTSTARTSSPSISVVCMRLGSPCLRPMSLPRPNAKRSTSNSMKSEPDAGYSSDKHPKGASATIAAMNSLAPHSWEDRMEHVGKHCEVMDSEEREDLALREWAIEEGVIQPYGPDKWLLASILNGTGKRACGYSS